MPTLATFALALSLEAESGVPPLTSQSQGKISVLSSRTFPLERGAIALAYLGDSHLAALTSDEVLVYRLEPRPTVEVREALRGPLRPTRLPAGMLISDDPESVWVFTNRTGRADLLVFNRQGTSWRSEAKVPPGFPDGLTYRVGTNILEGYNPGPLIAFLPGDVPIAIDERAHWLAFPGTRVGSALARVTPSLLVTSGDLPPGASDTLSFWDSRDGTLLETLSVPGSVRALAARSRGKLFEVRVGLKGADGAASLLCLELRP